MRSLDGAPWAPHFSGFDPSSPTPAARPEPPTPAYPIGRFETDWRTEVSDASRLLASTHAVVVLRDSAAAGAWDPLGNVLPGPSLVGTAGTFDRSGEYLLGVDPDGMPALAGLGVPSRPPRVALHYMGAREVREVLRCADVFAIATSTRPAWPSRKRAFTLLEFLQLRDAAEVDECGYIDGFEDLEAMSCEESTLPLIVSSPTGFAAATDGAVTRFDLRGEVVEVTALPSRPRGLASTRGGEWVAVVVLEERVNLWWAGTPSSQEVPTELSSWQESRPPLAVGENFAYLTPPGEVLGCTRDGQRFRFRRVGESQGVVTSTGDLLVEHEGGLWVCDTTGAARQVWAGDAPVVCPPALLGDHVFLATTRELIALRITL